MHRIPWVVWPTARVRKLMMRGATGANGTEEGRARFLLILFCIAIPRPGLNAQSVTTLLPAPADKADVVQQQRGYSRIPE